MKVLMKLVMKVVCGDKCCAEGGYNVKGFILSFLMVLLSDEWKDRRQTLMIVESLLQLKQAQETFKMRLTIIASILGKTSKK